MQYKPLPGSLFSGDYLIKFDTMIIYEYTNFLNILRGWHTRMCYFRLTNIANCTLTINHFTHCTI